MGAIIAALYLLLTNEQWFLAAAFGGCVVLLILIGWCVNNPTNPVAKFFRGLGGIIVSILLIVFGTVVIMLSSFTGADIVANIMGVTDQQQVFSLRAISAIVGAMILVAICIVELASKMSKP